MRITHCQVNHMNSPIGFKMDKAVFSYRIEEAQGTRQTKARIIVTKALPSGELDELSIAHDSGWKDELSPLCYESDLVLEPRTGYYWMVEAMTDAMEEGFSDWNYFETGKREEAWSASWITAPMLQNEEENARHPIFVKDLSKYLPDTYRSSDGKLDTQKLVKARLYICGLGLYEAYLGEKRIGSEYLTPYCNDYFRFLQVQTFDIFDELTESAVLKVMLGNGWYKGRFGFDPKKTDGNYGNKWALIAEVRLTFSDGSECVIGTDESWAVTRSQILFSNLYDGEILDQTSPLLPESPAELFCGSSDLPPDLPESIVQGKRNMTSLLCDRLSLPVHIVKRVPVKEILCTPKGELVLDMGQNLTGIFSLRVREDRGTKIFLQFGELLQEGCFYNDNLRSAKAEYTFITDGSEQTIQPHFTFYGYRFVKLEGVSDFQADDFEALVLCSRMELTGKMETGHAEINQLISNVLWGQRGNFVDVPTDCPQRDERMGWTGDAQVFCETACFFMDTYAFYRKYLFDMLEEQRAHGGRVPNVIPSFEMQGAACAWGDAATIIPWTLYRVYGDQGILEAHIEGMKAWCDYMYDLQQKDKGWRNQRHFGDWLALDNPDRSNIVLGGTDEGFLAEAHMFYSHVLTGKALSVLQEKEAASFYEKRAAELLDALRFEYYSPSGRCCVDTQTAHLVGLAFDITPDKEKSVKALRRQLALSHGELRTGFIGTPLLCMVLSEHGMVKEAFDILLHEEYPGWIYEIRLGATTIWERWNSVLPNGLVSDTTMNSMNHYAYGSIASWLFKKVAGLSQAEESKGFQSLLYRPLIDARLGYVKAEYDSPSGTYKSSWKLQDGKLYISLTVPFGCSAKAILPGREDRPLEVGPGVHELSYEFPTREK